ncbi:MAG: NosD domain-containing protein [bacterium]
MKNLVRTIAVCAAACLATADGSTLIVPDDYGTIQAAVDAAIANDTIQVNPGTYHEKVIVGKSVKIVGSDPATTIVTADGIGTNFLLTADGTTIAGLTIENGVCGLYISFADNCLFSNLIVSGITSFGTFSKTSKSNTFAECVFISNTWYGLCLGDTASSYNTVTNCDFHDNNIALQAYLNCSALRVANSTFYNNTGTAIQVGWLNPWLIDNCLIYSNVWGINIDTASGGTIKNCDFLRNTGAAIDFGGDGEYDDVIVSNNFIGNVWGVRFSVKGQRATVAGNTIALNDVGVAIDLHASTSYANWSNKVYGNDFIGNVTNAYVFEDRGSNFFDRGYTDGGNYWDDYTGVDVFSGVAQDVPGSDGIGDTPIELSPTCRDKYPRMARSRSLPGLRSATCFMSPSSGGIRTLLADWSLPERSINSRSDAGSGVFCSSDGFMVHGVFAPEMPFTDLHLSMLGLLLE